MIRRLLVLAALAVVMMLPVAGMAKPAAGACRASCVQRAKACLRTLSQGRTACANGDRAARKACRARAHAIAKAGKRSCRGYRVRCTACCRSGASTCAVTPEAVVATVGEAGGTLELRGFEGGTLAVEIPAGALGAPTEIRLEPLVADAGSLARFRVLPAGLTFSARATLRYAAAGALPARSVLRWRVEDARFPLPTTRNGGELRADTITLGYVFEQAVADAAGPGRTVARSGTGNSRAADEPSTELDVAPLDCDVEIAGLELQLAAAVRETDIVRAQAQADRLLAVIEACALREQAGLTARACEAYQAAATTAQVIAADSYERFRELVTPLLLTQADVQITGATCTAPSLDALLEAKFAQFLDFIEADYARPGLLAGFDTAARELRRLIDYDVACQAMGLFAVCARLDGSLIPTVLDRLRSAAFRECREDSSVQLLSEMSALVVVPRRILQPRRSDRARPAATSAASYLTYGRFTYADLEDDMAYCRSSPEIRVFEDARGVPTELEEQRVVLPASMQPGSHTTTAEVEVPRDGSVRIAGPIGTLTCPDGSVSADEVVARVNGVRLASRPAAGPTFATATSPFDLIVADVLAQALPPGTQVSEFTVELRREGAACGGLFSEHSLLYSIRVRVGAPTCQVDGEAVLVARSFGRDGGERREAPNGTAIASHSGALDSGSATVRFGSASTQARHSVDGQPHGGASASGEWSDQIVIDPADPTLMSRVGTLRARIAFAATGTANSRQGPPARLFHRLRIRVGGGRSDFDFQRFDDGTTSGPLPGTYEIGPFEFVFGQRFDLQVETMVAATWTGLVDVPHFGSAEGTTTARWLGITAILGPDGTPVAFTLCSASGTNWTAAQ